MRSVKFPVIIFLILTMILTVSCSNDEGVNDSGLAVSSRDAPAITGFFVTEEHSSNVRDVWGIPTGPSQYLNNVTNYPYQKPGDPVDPGGLIPTHFCLYVPYPNPFLGKVAIEYDLSRGTECKIWVVRGYPMAQENIPGATGNDLGMITVNVNYAPGVVADGFHEAGTHRVIIAFEEDGKLIYPYGFYRVYMQAGDFFDWADIYFTTEKVVESFDQ